MAAHGNDWMPLYIGDYLRDTTRLTAAEHGAYLLLIMDYWVNGPPPDDDRQLARIARTSVTVWRRHRREIVSKMFTIKGGFWVHKRIESELARAKEAIGQKRTAGLASAASRHARNGTAQPNGRCNSVRDSVRTQVYQDTDLRFKNLKGDLGCALEPEPPPEPPSAEDVAAVDREELEPHSAEDKAAVDQTVAHVLATIALPPTGLRRGVYDEAAYRQAINGRKREVWLNSLATWVGEGLPGLPEKMAAWEAIEAARNAGSRAATPPDIRRAVDALSRLRDTSVAAYAEAAE